MMRGAWVDKSSGEVVKNEWSVSYDQLLNSMCESILDTFIMWHLQNRRDAIETEMPFGRNKLENIT